MSLTLAFGFSAMLWLRRRGDDRALNADWSAAEEFSIDKYRPMQRLLCEEDFAFLKSQPGYHPALEKTLRRDRLRVFRSYVRSIRRDFDRLQNVARAALLFSDPEETGLLSGVVRQRMVFYYALALVEVRLVMYSFGMGSVNVQPLIAALKSMGDSARMLQPLPTTAL